MHIINCVINVGGDALNAVPKANVTTAELLVLQAIHGQSAVHSIEVIDNPSTSGAEERDRLLSRYPKYRKVVDAIWQNNGGSFPSDIRKIGLSSTLFKPDHEQRYKQADALEKKAKKTVRAAKAPKAESESEPAPAPVVDVEIDDDFE
jgi:hypothetical protein